MYTINDPMFALILRFVGRDQKVAFRDDEFIQKQLKAIQAYVGRFPPEEQESRAIEWIGAHAREYREIWEKEVVGTEFSHQRCPDCPLAAGDDPGHCQIHDEWLKLVQQYVVDEISSQRYVENALKLLAQCKENIKVKLSALKDKPI